VVGSRVVGSRVVGSRVVGFQAGLGYRITSTSIISIPLPGRMALGWVRTTCCVLSKMTITLQLPSPRRFPTATSFLFRVKSSGKSELATYQGVQTEVSLTCFDDVAG
jgi:hypothetical protein